MGAPRPTDHRWLRDGSDPAAVAVLGLGQMGLVCASLLASRGGGSPRVSIWGVGDDELGELAQTRQSDRLPGLTLPDGVRVALSAEEALAGVDLVVAAIPVQYIRATFDHLRPALSPRASIVSVAKGIENGTLLRPTQIIADVLDDGDQPRPLGVLSGPTIAAELAECLPATMVSASDDSELGEAVQRVFSTTWLRVYTQPDMLGVEVAGATKNVIAIAAGVLDGLKAGSNAKSALLARGLAEITRLGVAMGARQETFFGIAGVGDLVTSCFSPAGRNRSLGEALGRGESLSAYLARSRHVVEGVATTSSLMDLAARHDVEMPITAAVNAVLFEQTDPLDAIGRLMARDLKRERVG